MFTTSYRGPFLVQLFVRTPLSNSTAGTPIFLSLACSVVNALTTYFNQAKTSRKAKQNRPFQLKRAVFVELLPRFELGTSSLPTDWEGEISCFRDILCPFPFGGPYSPALLYPLFPPARFPVWVSVWVRRTPRRQKSPGRAASPHSALPPLSHN